jgi:hypothetical protein
VRLYPAQCHEYTQQEDGNREVLRRGVVQIAVARLHTLMDALRKSLVQETSCMHTCMNGTRAQCVLIVSGPSIASSTLLRMISSFSRFSYIHHAATGFFCLRFNARTGSLPHEGRENMSHERMVRSLTRYVVVSLEKPRLTE